MKLLVLIPFLTVLAVLPSTAEDKIDGFIARIYKNNHRQKMPYRIFIPPGYDRNKKYPIIIWLHGAGGGRGDDNQLQISGDQISGTALMDETGEPDAPSRLLCWFRNRREDGPAQMGHS